MLPLRGYNTFWNSSGLPEKNSFYRLRLHALVVKLSMALPLDLWGIPQ